MRLPHTKVVFMLGPEANQFVTVGHPENFHWRESSFGDLIPLLGDGLLTIDDDYHDRSRAIMLPAFHREQVEASTAAMRAEAEVAIAALAPDTVVDSTPGCVGWRCGSRCGRCSASTPTRRQGRRRRREIRGGARLLRHRLRAAPVRGPGSPWRRLMASRAVLDQIVYEEIARRRAAPGSGARDILSLLVGARGERASASPTPRSATR